MLMNGGIAGLLGRARGRSTSQCADRPRSAAARIRCASGTVPRVPGCSQVGDHVRADKRATVQHAGDMLQPLRDANAVHGRGDGGEGAQDAVRGDSDLKGV